MDCVTAQLTASGPAGSGWNCQHEVEACPAHEQKDKRPR